MPRRDPGRLDELRAALERTCAESGVSFRADPVPHGVKYALEAGGARGTVVLYATGRAVANPAAERDFGDVLAALAGSRALVPPRGAGARGAGTALVYPHLGSDESGKGDYFGPLVAAAVLLAAPREEELLRELGVRDSKLLATPREARELARQVRDVCAGRTSEVAIEPGEYNRRVAELRARGRSSSALLAWAHVGAWEPLLAHAPRLALADRFGDPAWLEREAEARGARVPLVQETGGERYTAVAAASILARDRCLGWFEEAERELGIALPRGAFDPAIVVRAREIVARGGRGELARFAKLHFRTTARVEA